MQDTIRSVLADKGAVLGGGLSFAALDTALLLSDNTAAAWLGVSRATWWRYVNSGVMPKPIRVGGSTRWRRDEIVAAIDRLTAERDGEAA